MDDSATTQTMRLPFVTRHDTFHTRRRAMLLAILVLASSSVEWAVAQDQTQPAGPLVWKFADGDDVKLALHQKTDTVTAIDKKLIRVTLEVHTDLRWTVSSADESGFAIEQTVASMSVKMQLPDKEGALEYDSKSEKAPRGAAKKLAAGIQPLLDSKVTFQMDSRGVITNVESSFGDEEGQGGQSDSLRALFTPEVMNEMLAQVFPHLPADASANWSSTAKRDLPLGQVLVATDYTRAAAEKAGQTRLTVKGKVSLGEQKPEQKRKIRLELGTLDGWLDFDHDAGRFASGDVTQVVVAESRERNTPIRTRVTSRLWFTLVER